MRRFSFLALCTIISILIVVLPHHDNSPPAQLVAALKADLKSITIIPIRPNIVGYDRALFGSGWASSIDTRSGQLCTTRELILARTFHYKDCSAKLPPGVVDEGKIADPYTGTALDPTHVDIDHIVPLSAAWDLGAWAWDAQRRLDFANDAERNLVAVDSTVNRDKSDATLSEWMPPDSDAHCAYAARFVHIIAHYDLALARADVDAARSACGV